MTGSKNAKNSDPDESSFSEHEEPKPTKKSKKNKQVTIEFGEADLKNFNAEKSKLIKEKNMEAGG